MATYQDLFTGANSDLTAHTPDSGGTWVEADDTAGSLAINVQNSNGTASPSGSVNGNRVIYTVDWVPATANYSVSFTSTVAGTGDDDASLIARYADVSNYYAMTLVGNAAVVIVKRVAGTYTNIAGAAVTVANGDVWKFELIGQTLKAYQNDVERASVSDASHSAKGIVGLGFGNIGGTELGINITDDDVNTGWDVDAFTLVDIAVAAGKPQTGLLMGVG